MAEVINTNVFDATKKFVDLAGLDYFWEKAKAYVDGVDTTLSGKITTLETAVDALTTGDNSVAAQIDAKIAALDVTDTAVTGEYVSAVSEVDGKIAVTRAALPDYTNTYDAKGAADQALVDAKAYVDGIVNDTTAEDGAVTKGLNSRIADLEAIDHDKLAADASAAAVATVLDGAPEKFDTLKEIAQWISDSESADSAADLVTRVNTLETTVGKEADGEDPATGLVKKVADLEAADATNLQAAKDYADGLKAELEGVITDNERVTAESLNDLNNRVNAIAGQDVYVKDDVDAQIAAAEANANAYTDQLKNSIQIASNADIDGLFA